MPARLELPAIVLVALIALAIVQPFGNFPLDDDENHAIATWNFVHLHRFQFAIDTTPPLRAQVLWGSLWVVLFGESFNVLRASTMFLGILMLIVVNRTMLLAGIPRGPRVVATLALLFNPMFFWATNTYMTETPFVCASAIALYCFFRAIRNDSIAWFVGGCAAVAASWWIRQGIINIFPPLIVLAALRGRATKRWKPMLAISIAVFVGYAVMAILRRDLIVASPIEFQQHYKFWGEGTFHLEDIVAFIFSDYFLNIQHTALFFLPLSLGVALAWPRQLKRVLIALLVIFGGRAAYIVANHNAIPYYNWPICCDLSWGNVFMNFGLGPPTVTDVWNGVHPYPWHLPQSARVAIMAVSVVVAAFALVTVIIRRQTDNLLFLLAAASVIVGTVTLIVSGQYVDRYSLDTAWAVVFLFAFTLQWDLARVRVAAVAALAVLAVFSVLATQEYFAWNRARWAAWWELRQHNIPIRAIDGGAEPFLYYEMSQAKDIHERRRMAFAGSSGRPYTIAFGPMQGYRVIATHPFTGWLGLHRGAIVTLQRI
jgi:hypothetical protein